MAEALPSASELWQEAGEDPAEYRRLLLLRELGLLIPGKPGPLCGGCGDD